ncbi:MAG TPA: family 43 glycosylhydrolase [Chloroflexia bacterium]|nr:family 43 glycosylhydrolase [Chloroflexia bacterium]
MRKTRSDKQRLLSILGILSLLLSLFVATAQPTNVLADDQNDGQHRSATYRNPLDISIPGDGKVQSCADPSIIHSQTPGDTAWYIYCTTDPLNGNDRNASGDLNFHLIPMHKSYDLVHWTYVGDAFATRPAWVAPTAGLWAPDIHFFNGKYYLYYTAPDTTLPGGSSAIGVATAPTPTGPWTDSGGPVVEPRGFWTFDPAVIEYNGDRYIFFGSYYGGVAARKLSADGLHSDPATQVQITIPNRYEGSFIVKHGDYYYYFGSATNCCNGPLTGYSVFAGRSKNPLGPYVDREGNSLLAGRVGGTPVISMNGNRWVGPGHNAVFTDFDGQDWFLYHAVDQNDPYFAGSVGFTKRPVLMDPLDWVDGWPTVRGGLWASDKPMPAPAAQPGEKDRYHTKLAKDDRTGQLVQSLTDNFNGSTLSSNWQWVRQPAPGTYGLENGTFRFDTQNADLYVDSNNASVLTEPTPNSNYIVETKVKLDVPPEGCCQNYVQAGLVIYGDDDNFIKLAHVSIWETRQTEFAKELSPVPAGYPRYGNTVAGTPGEWTWLRIAVKKNGNKEFYTAYTSQDGVHWVHGGTWTHNLGSTARIGLISMGGSGFHAYFDYVRVYRLIKGDEQEADD